MNRYYRAVAQRAGNRCEYCLAPEYLFNSRHEVEHIIPDDLIDSELTGLALACRSCNSHKSDFTSGKASDGSICGLYNPRTKTWSEHFEFSEVDGYFRGKTRIGEATIQRLNLNSVEQNSARLLWLSVGLVDYDPYDEST